MRIGIIAAMPEELELLKQHLSMLKEVHFGKMCYHTGVLSGHEVVLLLCGIGKVNAAVGTTLLIEKLNPDYIINTGVAGGCLKELNVGDIVVSTEVRHHDADVTVFNYEYGQIPRMPAAYQADPDLRRLAVQASPEGAGPRLFHGPILSGDSFVHTSSQISRIRQQFPSVAAVEMEGAAIAQTCYVFGIPFLVIRSISDLVSADASHAMYQQSMPAAAQNSAALVMNLVKNLGAM